MLRRLTAGLIATTAAVAAAASPASAGWQAGTVLASTGGCSATAVGPTGTSVAVWARGGSLFVTTRRIRGFWGPPKAFAPTPATTLPTGCEVAVDAGGVATVLWNDAGGVFTARATDPLTWTARRVPGAVAGTGHLSVPATGSATVLYRTAATSVAGELRSVDLTATGYTAPLTLGPVAATGDTVVLEGGPASSDTLAVWDADPASAGFESAVRSPGGAWRPAGTVPVSGRPGDGLFLVDGAVGPSGEATLVVTGPVTATSGGGPITIFDRPAGGTWTGTPFSGPGYNGLVAYDGGGTATFAFEMASLPAAGSPHTLATYRRPRGGALTSSGDRGLATDIDLRVNAAGDAVLGWAAVPAVSGVLSPSVATSVAGGPWSATTVLGRGGTGARVGLGAGGTRSAVFSASNPLPPGGVPSGNYGFQASGDDGPAAPPDTTPPVIRSSALDPYVFPSSATPLLRAALSEPARLTVSLQRYSGETKTFFPYAVVPLTAFTTAPAIGFHPRIGTAASDHLIDVGLFVATITATDSAGNVSAPSATLFYIPTP